MYLLIFYLFIIGVVFIGAFFLARCIVMLWTGADSEEATSIIHRLCNQGDEYHLANDNFFWDEIWSIIHDIIGEKNFYELVTISRITKVYDSGYVGGVSHIKIVAPYNSDHEKNILENLLAQKVEDYLQIHNFAPTTLVEWKEHLYLKLPCIIIYYAETDKQLANLKKIINMKQNLATSRYKSFVDEEIEDD